METKKQQGQIGNVMGEFKEGKLKSGKDGVGGEVKSRNQALAIALSEAGLSKKRNNKK